MYIDPIYIYKIYFKSLLTFFNLWNMANYRFTEFPFDIEQIKKLALSFSWEHLGANFSEMDEFQMDILYFQTLYFLYVYHDLKFYILSMGFFRPTKSSLL